MDDNRVQSCRATGWKLQSEPRLFLIGYCQMLVILSERVMNNAQLIITVLLTTEVFFQSKTA